MDAQPFFATTVHTLHNVLRAVGWLDEAQSLSRIDTSLLPVLLEHCGESCSEAERSPDRKKLKRWIAEAVACGAELRCWPLPAVDDPREVRLLWCPRGWPAGRRIGVLSSHLGHRPDELREWFWLLTEIIEQVKSGEHLVVAGRITARPWLEHAARRLSIALLAVECPSQACELAGAAEWLRRLPRMRREKQDEQRRKAFLSPALLPSGSYDSALGDRVVLQLADAIYLLRLLPGGRLAHHSNEYLNVLGASDRTQANLSSTDRPQQFHLAVGPRLVPERFAATLAVAGGRIWRRADAAGARRKRLQRATYPQRHCPSITDRRVMLTHWTRAVSGPWPDQTIEQFRDDLLFDRPGGDHSALAALLRMAAMRRVCASAQTVRGRFPVVCFSAVPLAEFTGRTIYRRHRSRWDFCRYGLSISQQWLEARGARPVIYGDDDLWDTLPPADQPFFQCVESRTLNEQPIDWRLECEWRVLGDVDLSELAANDAHWFVPTRAEARWLMFLSRWPVIVLEES